MMVRSRKSILVVTERFYPEEFGINDLVLEWKRKGVEVEILTQSPSYPFGRVYDGYRNRLYQATDWEGIKIHRIYSLLGYNKSVLRKVANYLFFALYACIIALVIGRRFENVFVYHTGPLTQALPAILMKKVFRSRLFVWTLDIWPDSVFAYGFKKTRLSEAALTLFVKSVYRNCTAVFISCKGFKNKILNYAPNTDIVFAPQWAPADLDFEKAAPNPNLKEGFNFTFAGNIGKVQNLENVIDGFSRLETNSENGRSIHLNIVGDGSNLANLKAIVEKQSIKNIHFWGRKPLTEMPSWFEGSDALVISLAAQPIFALTVPAKFQAYLAAGKPILCIMKGEVADMVSENAIGLTADPEDVEEIAHAFEIFSLLAAEKQSGMIQNARQLLDNDYDRQKIIDRTTEVIFGAC